MAIVTNNQSKKTHNSLIRRVKLILTNMLKFHRMVRWLRILGMVPISKINAGIKGSMQKLLQYILPFELPHRFPDVMTYHLYKKWDKPARQIQIAAITFLTALLYIVFSFLD